MNINLNTLEEFIYKCFVKVGIDEISAKRATDTFMRATLRGVGHHDVNDLIGRLNSLKTGKINPKPQFKKVHSFGGVARFDADNSLGEIACDNLIDEGIELAKVHGVAICTAYNTNHYLCSYPYLQRAVEAGYIAMVLAKSAVGVGTSNTDKACMSALPMGFSFPTSDGSVIADFCLAYASVGELQRKVREDEELKEWWGKDKDGNFTTSAKEVLDGGVRMAIGDHKGFALSMLGEVLTGVIATSTVMDNAISGELKTNTSHTIIVINPEAFMSLEEFKTSAEIIPTRAKERSEGKCSIPGERSQKVREELLEKGYIDIPDTTIEKLNSFASEFGMEKLG